MQIRRLTKCELRVIRGVPRRAECGEAVDVWSWITYAVAGAMSVGFLLHGLKRFRRAAAA